MMRNILFVLCFYTAGFLSLQAQEVPYLDKPVNLDISDRSIAEVFRSISEQTSVVFSYTRFNDQKKISVNCYRKPLRIALNEILSTSGCTYKLKGKYIIIKCPDAPKPPAFSDLSGYVYNAADSTRIDLASVYVEKTRHSSLTNEEGFFILSCPEVSPKILLSVAKENYYDTTVAIYNPRESSLRIYLHPKPAVKEKTETVIQPVKPDTVLTEKKDSLNVRPEDFLKKFRAKFKTFNTNFKNITDTLFSGFAVSLVPYVSTNRLLSINTVNKYSFNVLAGYSKGVDVLEIGGVMNIDDGNVRYFQVAGVGNIVSGNFSGLQLGGIVNMNKQRTNGMQVAGIYNQTGKMNGWQIAGILNQAEDHARGMQLSGLVNKADTMDGFQLAGFLNEAEYVRGVQVSGFINTAKKLHGVQLGFLNFSDTCSGAPIGFFSFVKKGYHKIGLEADELFFGTLSFGSGSDYFHTIFLGGVNMLQRDIFSYGYGIGSAYKISKRWTVSLDVTARQLQSTAHSQIRLNLLNRALLGVEYAPFPKLRIGLGPSYNVMVSDITGDNYSLVAGVLPSRLLYDTISNDIHVKIWMGATFSVRFL